MDKDMKKKMITVVGVIIIVVALVLIFVLLQEPTTDETVEPDTTPDTTTSDLSTLEAMQLEPPEDYIERLKAIIEGDPDPYTRERAVLILTELALRKNDTGEIIDFMKDLAMEEEDENVRTSAYVSVDLIRDKFPLEPTGSLELSISGDIKKGADITLIATVSTTSVLTADVIVGITSLDNDIELLSDQGGEKFQLNANQPQEARFDLRLTETGEYYIPVAFMISFDSVDYEKIKKELHIQVNEADGEILGVL